MLATSNRVFLSLARTNTASILSFFRDVISAELRLSCIERLTPRPTLDAKVIPTLISQ